MKTYNLQSFIFLLPPPYNFTSLTLSSFRAEARTQAPPVPGHRGEGDSPHCRAHLSRALPALNVINTETNKPRLFPQAANQLPQASWKVWTSHLFYQLSSGVGAPRTQPGRTSDPGNQKTLMGPSLSMPMKTSSSAQPSGKKAGPEITQYCATGVVYQL